MGSADHMGLKSALRARARLTLALLLSLPQVLWHIGGEWPKPSAAVIAESVVLALALVAAVVPRHEAARVVGFGLLMVNPSVLGLMTATLGSVTPYGRTGIEMFGMLGFSWGAAFVCGYWLNRWLDAFESGQSATRLSTRALFVIALFLCTPSILAGLGELLLHVSYPDGLIPTDTLWARAMVWVMLVSAPAALLGLGLLVLAAPIVVHLIRSRGLASAAGRAATVMGLLALVSAALCLN